MKKICLVILAVTLSGQALYPQELKTRNIVIVTLDGFRWQEVFGGADSAILFNPAYCRDKAVASNYWSVSPEDRRRRLLPFFWSIIASEGQLYGNRTFENKVSCANPHWFSYPGYSELFAGFVDRKVRSNDAIENPNSTVLEFIHQQTDFDSLVAAFATWEVFPFILREEKSGIYVNAGKDVSRTGLSEREDLLNELQSLMPNPYGARYDAFTFYYAFEFLKRERPRVLFIGLDETDEHSHKGKYDEYLKSAHRADEMLRRMWQWLQSQPEYKDQTTLIVTTDHGRGKSAREGWKKHGRLAFGSGQVWIAAIGPDTPPTGEMKTASHFYLKNIAATCTSLLGLEYSNTRRVGDVIKPMISQHETDAGIVRSGSNQRQDSNK